MATDWFDHARVATLSNVANISTQSPGLSIDNVCMCIGDRVFVRAQTDQIENGIYQYNGAPPGNPMTRTADLPMGATAPPDMVIRVSEGALLAHTEHVLVTQRPSGTTVGTNTLSFAVQNLVVDIRDFGARLDGQSVSDGSINNGSNILTSASYTFQPEDKDKLIVVQFAGAMGAPLATTIACVPMGGGPATLATTASWTTTPSSTIATTSGSSTTTINLVIPGKPTTIQTSSAHGYSTGDIVAISGTGLPTLDMFTFPITLVDATHFTVPVNTTSGSTTGMAVNQTVHVITTGMHGLVTGMTVNMPSILLWNESNSSYTTPANGYQVKVISDTEFSIPGQIAGAVTGGMVTATGGRVDWGTDDHMAWSEAIAAASTAGAYSATVRAGPGVSLVSDTIVVQVAAGNAGITISGAGPGGQFASTGTQVILASSSASALINWKNVNSKLENIWLDGANLAPATLLVEYFTSNCLFDRLLVSGAVVGKGAEINFHGTKVTDEIDNLHFHRTSIFHDPRYPSTPAKSFANVQLIGDSQAGQITFEYVHTFDGAWAFYITAGGINIDHAQIFDNTNGMIYYDAIQWSHWNDIYTERNSNVLFITEGISHDNGPQPVVVSGCRISDNCEIRTGCKQPLVLIGNSLAGDVVIVPAAPPANTILSGTATVNNGSSSVIFSTAQTLVAGMWLRFSSQPGVTYIVASSSTSSTSATLTTTYTGTSDSAATATIVSQPVGIFNVADHGTAFAPGHGFAGDLTHLDQFSSQAPVTTAPVYGYYSSSDVTSRLNNLTTQKALTIGGSEAQHTTILSTLAYLKLTRFAGTAQVIGWYDAAIGVTVDGSGNVSAWADQSGYGYTLSQAAADLLPAYVKPGGGARPYVNWMTAGSSVALAGAVTLHAPWQ
jgi:hypothetical protein